MKITESEQLRSRCSRPFIALDENRLISRTDGPEEFAVVESGLNHNSMKHSQFPKRNSFFWNQPTITISNVILSSASAGYSDHFYPEKVPFIHRIPSRRLQLEAKLTDLITPDSLQVNDITVLSSFRKDSFCTISNGLSGEVLFLAHQMVSSNYQLPFYKGNLPILQNGFKLRVKDIDGDVVLTFVRNTLYEPQGTDMLEVWLGDKIHPVGQVYKTYLSDRYIVDGETDFRFIVIQKDFLFRDDSDDKSLTTTTNNTSITCSKKLKKQLEYMIIGGDTMTIPVGSIKCKNSVGRSFPAGESPFSVQFKEEIGIIDKALILGTLFLIAARVSSQFEKLEI